jgi:AcrR family transcriptional regulator
LYRDSDGLLAITRIGCKHGIDAGGAGQFTLGETQAQAPGRGTAGMSDKPNRSIIDEATSLLAEVGVRGATLRKIGARSGVNFARLATPHGGKDQLLAACFSDVVERDLKQLAAIVEEFARVEVGNPAPFLWALCEDAGGARRADNLVLTELLLASTRPELNGIFRDWLTRRHKIMRSMAVACDMDPVALDVLGLIVLMECAFAVSNYRSVTYRFLANLGVREALARLSGRTLVIDQAEVAQHSANYFIDYAAPQPAKRAGDNGAAADGRSRIVEAAAAIIQEEGVDQLTNRAIAKRAGVSLALTTYHFPSINELVVAGLRRVVEVLAASLEPDVTRDQIRAVMLADRRNPAGASENLVRVHRGWLQISLMAARSPREERLGYLMRRQVGLRAFAGVDEEKRGTSVSRTAAASYALWSGGAYLVARAFPLDEQPFDFAAQAQLAARCLLGIG